MEIQDVAEYCVECSVMKDLECGKKNIETARYNCSHCRTSSGGGIYKADAIYTALKYKKRADTFNRRGKCAVVVKRYGKAVAELTAKGESLRSIASILGISVVSVRKCRAEWKAERSDTQDNKS